MVKRIIAADGLERRLELLSTVPLGAGRSIIAMQCVTELQDALQQLRDAVHSGGFPHEAVKRADALLVTKSVEPHLLINKSASLYCQTIGRIKRQPTTTEE